MVKRGPCARRPGHFQVFAEPATSLRPRVLAGRSNIFLPFTRTAGMPRGLGQAASFGLGFATWTRAMGPGYRAVSFLPCLCLGFSICQQQQQQQQQVESCGTWGGRMSRALLTLSSFALGGLAEQHLPTDSLSGQPQHQTGPWGGQQGQKAGTDASLRP